MSSLVQNAVAACGLPEACAVLLSAPYVLSVCAASLEFFNYFKNISSVLSAHV